MWASTSAVIAAPAFSISFASSASVNPRISDVAESSRRMAPSSEYSRPRNPS